MKFLEAKTLKEMDEKYEECGIDYDVAKRILEDCLDVWDLNDIGRFGGSLLLEYPLPDSEYYDTIGVVMDKYLPNETMIYLDCD